MFKPNFLRSLASPLDLKDRAEHFVQASRNFEFDIVCAIEAQGIIWGGIVSHSLGKGLVILKKKKSFSGASLAERFKHYDGHAATMFLHDPHAIRGKRVLIIDDSIRTGQHIIAASRLITHAGAHVTGALVEFYVGNKRNWDVDFRVATVQGKWID